MRELKFRAWDKIANEMVFSGTELSLRMLCEDGEFEESDEIGFSSFEYRRFDVMQFTGIQDNNGIDIFEGDIIQWGENIEVVSYSEQDAMFETETSMIDSCMSVIGNIHERR